MRIFAPLLINKKNKKIMLDGKMILNVVIGLIAFRLIDKMLLSKVDFLSSFEAEQFESLDNE